MEKVLSEFEQNAKSNTGKLLAEKSRTKYMEFLRKILTKLQIKTVEQLEGEKDNMINVINSMFTSLNSQKLGTCAVSALFRLLDIEHGKISTEVYEKKVKIEKLQEEKPPIVYDNNLRLYKNVSKKLRKTIDYDETSLNEKILLELLLNYPALRTSDYFNIKIRNIQEGLDPAYIIDGVLYINEGTKIKNKLEPIILHKPLKKLIKEDMKINKSDYLIYFVNAKTNEGGTYTRAIKRVTKKFLGRVLTLNDIRRLHVYNNEMNIKDKEPFYQALAREKLARKMNHSIEAQQIFYNRGMKKEEQEEK